MNWAQKKPTGLTVGNTFSVPLKRATVLPLQCNSIEENDVSDVGFGILLGFVGSLLFAAIVILAAILKSLKCLLEIRDLLKDRKGD